MDKLERAISKAGITIGEVFLQVTLILQEFYRCPRQLAVDTIFLLLWKVVGPTAGPAAPQATC